MRTTFTTLIGLFLWLTLNTQSLDQLPLDSLLQWVSDKAPEIYANDNVSEVHHYAYLCLIRAKKSKQLKKIVDASQNLALLHYMMEDKNVPDSTLFYDEMALNYLLKTDDQKAIAKAYSYIGNDYANLEDYDNALSNLLKSIEIYESIKDQEGLANNFQILSFLYATTHDYERSVEYGKKAIEIDLSLGVPDSVNMGINWFYLVRSYVELERLDEALQAANQSINFIEPYAEQNVLALTRAYSLRGETYQARKDYELALKDYHYAWEFGKSHVAHDSMVAEYQEGIGEVLRLQGNCAEAIPYYEGFIKAMEMRDAASPANLFIRHHELADCYEQAGEFQKALEQQKIATHLKDTLASNRYKNLESELIQKYESDKKDEQIALQTATIQQQKQIQWLSIGLAALFALLLLGLFLNYRRNQKTNALLQNLNQSLAQKNQQNELLLKEIHHRVKNNLQTISSLLSLQSAHIEDPKVQGAVEQSQNRVRSMALIHQKLYQGENLAAVEMKEYLQILGETIVDTFGIDSEQVEIEYPMEEVELDVDTAIPLGLIANELLTNALKYAFPDKQNGKIKVSLQRIGETFKFLVADDGVGIQKGLGSPKSGFGSQLINLLVLQLGGKVSTQSRDGFVTKIEFSIE